MEVPNPMKALSKPYDVFAKGSALTNCLLVFMLVFFLPSAPGQLGAFERLGSQKTPIHMDIDGEHVVSLDIHIYVRICL